MRAVLGHAELALVASVLGLAGWATGRLIVVAASTLQVGLTLALLQAFARLLNGPVDVLLVDLSWRAWCNVSNRCSSSAYLVLLELFAGRPRTVGDLGAKLGMDTGTITPLLKRLATAGKVSRTRDVADERRVLIDLTLAGEALRGQDQ